MIKVRIECTAYNQAPYIRKCLEGFVMQKTNFKFVAVVHDDASTDGTAEIIREFAEKYPDIIKPFFETENQYSKNTLRHCLYKIEEQYPARYKAICEGDDYWTDPYKLQRQVDFLDSHPDYSICSHMVGELYQETGEIIHRSRESDIEYSLLDAACGRHYFQTLSVVFRADLVTPEIKAKHRIWQDVVNVYTLLKFGKGFCFKEEMGVYRIHGGGVWSRTSIDQRAAWDFRLRQSIYDTEQTAVAALGLVWCFCKPTSRLWLIKNHAYTVPALRTIGKSFGFFTAAGIFLKKFILDENVNMDSFLENHRKDLDV